ncbi:MAG: cyclase family protein [Acidiferrobacteraceae bacterium]
MDALNHFGYRGKIFNNYSSEEHLGSRGWTKNGAEQIDPIIARGVLLDVAGLKGVECLPPQYGITVADLEETCRVQEIEVQEGDVVLVRTGRMRYWPDGDKVFGDSPGLILESARWITSKNVVAVGADNEAVEKTPPGDPDVWLPVHCHLLAEAGVPQMECLDLEALAADQIYEFGFIGAPIRLRGATGSPLRPLAFPLR